MARTNLREVLEAIGSSGPGLTDEKDAVALLDMHLGLVQACNDADSLAQLIKVRDGAKKALDTTFKVRTESVLARSHADPLVEALAPVERLIERLATDAKAQKDRFDKRWDELSNRFVPLIIDIGKSKFGAEPDKGLKPVLDALQVNDNRIRELKAATDYAQANKELDQTEKNLKAFDKAFAPANDKVKKQYLLDKAKLQPTIDKMDPAVAAKKFGSPPRKPFDLTADFYGKMRALMDKGEDANDYFVAGRGLQSLNDSFSKLLKASFTSLNADWDQRRTRAQKLIDGIGSGAFADADDKPLKAALNTATAAMKRAEPEFECGAAIDTFEPLEKEVVAVRTAAVQGLAKAGTKDPKGARAKAIAMMKHDGDAMKALADQPGGPELLDAMVGNLGGEAKGKDNKDFVRSAITARFGPELGDQDLTTKYLPRLYKVLGMVPGSHTLDNPKLKLINRERTKLETSGDYTARTRTINLKAPRTGLGDSLVSFGMRALPEKLIGKTLSGKDVSQFDVLALHEVAHAVDDKQKFMQGKLGNVSFGGWQTHSIDDVVAMLGDGKGFYKEFADLGKPFLQAYLKAVLQKKKPQDQTTVTGQLKDGAKPQWKSLAKHDAVVCAENIRMKNSESGLWDRGDSAATKYAIGGSVYQESYEGDWVSYALSARSAKISDYQFRADGEWYAEAYAAFFLGKLKESHPLHAVLTKDKKSTEAAKRAAR